MGYIQIAFHWQVRVMRNVRNATTPVGNFIIDDWREDHHVHSSSTIFRAYDYYHAA